MSEMSEGTEKRAAVVEGNLVVPQGARFALVASRFNHFIVDRLVDGALDAIVRHGGDASRITIVRVSIRTYSGSTFSAGSTVENV